MSLGHQGAMGMKLEAIGEDPSILQMKREQSKYLLRRAIAPVYNQIKMQMVAFPAPTHRSGELDISLVRDEWFKYLKKLTPRQRDRYRPETHKDRIRDLCGEVEYRPEPETKIATKSALLTDELATFRPAKPKRVSDKGQTTNLPTNTLHRAQGG
jgi:hypothetical protein